MSIHSQRLPALQYSGQAPELVLLHGWGMSSRIWLEWLPRLRRRCNVTLVDLPGYGPGDVAAPMAVDEVLEQLRAALPTRAVLLGYSLGGMLAVALAARCPDQVRGVLCLATNRRFVASDDWPEAMANDTFEQFRAGLAAPAAALKRFQALQVKGDARERELLKHLRQHRQTLPQQTLQRSLDWLAALDLAPYLEQLQCPLHCVFGECDTLVPAAAAGAMAQYRSVNVQCLPGAAHALMLSAPEALAVVVEQCLVSWDCLDDDERPPLRNKRDVARSFSRAADSYDSVAELQRRVAAELLAMVPANSSDKASSQSSDESYRQVLDLGCGTGFCSTGLRQLDPSAEVVGLDLAEGMCRYAAREHGAGHWLVGDAENLPLAEHSVALVFSSLAIQWCEDIHALFSEVHRVLRPGGECLVSTLGPDTLGELRRAWEVADDRVHVNSFASRDTVLAAIQRAGFERLDDREQRLTLVYPQLRELTRELKALGAHNVNSGRPAGLTGKQRLRRMMAAYDQQRDAQGLLPATYQVWYWHLRKPLNEH